MRFLADMGISKRVVSWLREQGHDVEHLDELGLERLDDLAIFDKAGAEDRVVLTFDLDFGELLARSRGAAASVVLFRLHNTTSPFVFMRLLSALADAKDELAEGAIVVVEDARHRVRPRASGPG